MEGSITGGVFKNGVRGLAALAAFVSVYCVKPPPGAVRNSEAPEALMVAGGMGGIAIGVELNDGKMENAGVPDPVGAPNVGGPVNFVAEPPANKALPCGIEPIRATICESSGGFSTGSVVGACVTQMPGSM